jgi:hypothetical protein
MSLYLALASMQGQTSCRESAATACRLAVSCPAMASPNRWRAGALAGLACGMRTFAGPGALAARGRIRGRAGRAVLLASAGELAADKSPRASDRTDLPALAGRIVAGAYTGRAVAGARGAMAGALSAAAGTYASWRGRHLVVEASGLPDAVVAVAEDLLAYGLAAAVTRAPR